jgi:ATP-dependent RNA helicase DHX37/DHR1
LQKEEDKETRKALDGRLGKRKRQTEDFNIVPGDDEDSDHEDLGPVDEQDGDVGMDMDVVKTFVPVVIADGAPPPRAAPEVGSALRKNPDGTLVQPKVRQRTKGKQVGIPRSTISHCC